MAIGTTTSLVMRKQFELRLCNYTLFAWLSLIGIMASIVLAVVAVDIGSVPKGNWQFVILLVVGGSGFYGVYRLVKKVAVDDALLTVEPNCLIVHYIASNKTLVIPFNEVASYRDEFLRDGRELRIRLHSGKKIKVAINSFLGYTGDYESFLQAVQYAIAEANATNSVIISREKSFFEKPFATILLIVYSVVMLFAISDILIEHKPFKGSFVSAIGALLSYAGMWYAARVRHKQL